MSAEKKRIRLSAFIAVQFVNFAHFGQDFLCKRN